MSAVPRVSDVTASRSREEIAAEREWQAAAQLRQQIRAAASRRAGKTVPAVFRRLTRETRSF